MNARLGELLAGGGHGEHLEFEFARLPQARLRGRQVGIVVAGMANELPCPVGTALSNGLKQLLIQGSGDLNSESAIGCYESLSIDGAAKLSRKATQNADLSEARPQIGLRQKLA